MKETEYWQVRFNYLCYIEQFSSFKKIFLFLHIPFLGQPWSDCTWLHIILNIRLENCEAVVTVLIKSQFGKSWVSPDCTYKHYTKILRQPLLQPTSYICVIFSIFLAGYNIIQTSKLYVPTFEILLELHLNSKCGKVCN